MRHDDGLSINGYTISTLDIVNTRLFRRYRKFTMIELFFDDSDLQAATALARCAAGLGGDASPYILHDIICTALPIFAY